MESLRDTYPEVGAEFLKKERIQGVEIMKTRLYAFALVVICIVLMTTNFASAAIVYDVTGTVDSISTMGAVVSPFSVGHTLTGQFTFEVTTPPLIGPFVNYSVFPGAVTSVTLEIGPGITDVNAPAADAVTHNFPSPDELDISLDMVAATVGDVSGLTYSGGGLDFSDPTGTLFTSNPPPLVLPDHPSFTDNQFRFYWGDPTTESLSIRGVITNISRVDDVVVIPAPSALVLSLIGVVSLGVKQRRRKH